MSKYRRRCEILRNEQVAADHYEMDLETPLIGGSAAAGQFVNVKAAEGTTDPLLRIPLGIHSATASGITLLYKVVGPGTSMLSRKKEGAVIDVVGPLGNGFDHTFIGEKADFNALLIAGGHGVAPLYALARELALKKIKITVLIGADTAGHLLCESKFTELGCEVLVATEDGTRGEKGYVTCLAGEKLRALQERPGEAAIYSCGPKPMLASLTAIVEKTDVPLFVSVDEYMACGIGACRGCAIPTTDGYKLVCKDGPVFEGREIKWDGIDDRAC